MRKLNEIAEKLREELAEHFRTVRITAIQNADQFLSELKAINPDKLPGVLIVFDNFAFTATSTVREIRVTLVLLDRFLAKSDDKALSLFQAAETLLLLFPPEGRDLDGVFVRPEDCFAASPQADYAAMALGLIISQGI